MGIKEIKKVCKDMRKQGKSYFDIADYLNDIIYNFNGNGKVLNELYKMEEYYHSLYLKKEA